MIGFSGYGYVLDEKNKQHFIGVKNVGKDFCADIFKEEFLKLFPNGNVIKISFADQLKNLVCNLFQLDRDFYDTPENKEIIIEHLNMTFRSLLEKIGLFLKNLDQNIWIRLLFQEIEKKQNPQKDELILIPDVRFPDEWKAIKEKNGILCQVQRDLTMTTTTPQKIVNLHPTNSHYEEIIPDYQIHNNNDSDLSEIIRKILISNAS